MDILEELKYYCETVNPVGALMLSGEWGCGKTYLIKNKLIDVVKDKCVVLCISLFGLDSIESIKQEVRKQWIEKAGEIGQIENGNILSKATDGYKKILGTVKGILPEGWQKKGEVVSSLIDLINFVPIINKMWDKNVVLVFDDLERSNIPGSYILGCINDYCENQHFNVIIVANEEKIRETASGKGYGSEAKNSGVGLSYGEIKEKIVQRVIYFTPDYKEVVDNSIKELVGGIEYKGFLNQNKEMLVKVLAGDVDDNAILALFRKDNCKLIGNQAEYDEKENELRELLKLRPHNIRSLKCAIQDFERVYDLLRQVGIDDCNGWLISFTCYMMVYKAGLIKNEPRYGHLFSETNVKKLYPDFFNSGFMVYGIAQWIGNGVWNQSHIKDELEIILKREEAESSVDKLRTNRLIDVEDETIAQGFPDLLKLVYSGKLTLDEYVNFIRNSYYARTCEVDVPDIDWLKVKAGIESQFKQMLAPDYRDSHFHYVIDPENKKYYTEDEWSAYQTIKDFREQDRLKYEKNCLLYIELLSNNLGLAFEALSNKRYDALTPEMEIATYNAYKNAKNNDKQYFSDWFSRIWIDFRNIEDMDIQLTEESLKKLREDLNTLKRDYKEQKKNIAAKHTQRFIDEIDKLLEVEGAEGEGNEE